MYLKTVLPMQSLNELRRAALSGSEVQITEEISSA